MRLLITLLCLRLAIETCGNQNCHLCFPLTLQMSELQTHS